MQITEKEFTIPKGTKNIMDHVTEEVSKKLSPGEIPIRFVITRTDENNHYCETDVIHNEKQIDMPRGSIFKFRKRKYASDKFNAVLLIPTGIGAELGGHCGDGNALAKFIASACDTLVVHPNVVNASDINEMAENTLYVEGSIVTRLLMGQVGLQKVRSNRVLMLADKHKDYFFNEEIINSVSVARVSLGMDCDILEMDNIIHSKSSYTASGRAAGKILYLERLFDLIQEHMEDYDAIALATLIDISKKFREEYFENTSNLVNPWGGIEAMLTHSISERFNIPCAHSPMPMSKEEWAPAMGIVDPRKASESNSASYLHCILKGLHKSPRIISPGEGFNVEDVSCLVIPDGCIGLPILAALEQGIPVIAVKENKNRMQNNLMELPFPRNKLIIVENYLEAVGVMNALKAGISLESVRRPISHTKKL